MRVLVTIALRNLVQARRRTALLSMAIGLVTALLVLLQAMANGIEDNMIRAATTVTAGHVNVAGFWKPKSNTAAPFLVDKAAIRAVIDENTPGLDYVVERHRGWVKLVSDSASIYSALNGLEAEHEERFFETVRQAPENTYFEGGAAVPVGDPRELAERGTVVLFRAQAKRLEVKVGDPVTLQAEDPSGRVNTVDTRVVAVLEDMGFLSSWATFVPADDVRQLYDISDETTGAFWVYLKEVDQAEPAMWHLREVFAQKGFELMDHQAAPYFMKFDVAAGEDWTGQRLDLTTWRDEVSFLTWILTGFDTITWFLVMVLVAIVAVGIMNTMWNSVRDRTSELGTMRAIGMRRGQVLLMILFEALFLGLFATGAGAVLGVGLAHLVNQAQVPVGVDAVKAILLSETILLSVRAEAVAQAVGMLTLFTVLAASWPARRAAGLSPITAIQHTE